MILGVMGSEREALGVLVVEDGVIMLHSSQRIAGSSQTQIVAILNLDAIGILTNGPSRTAR